MGTSITLGLTGAFVLALGAALAETNGSTNAPATSDDAAGAARYQSFGYNSQLKQCATPAACGIHGQPQSEKDKDRSKSPERGQ
ncbi:MAG TPA: hypothetical protein VKV77_03365 [Methylovirgula sp.]|nr:hypothetical protein [Methylovirgula sp.]